MPRIRSAVGGQTLALHEPSFKGNKWLYVN
jgi:hypothetical protein